jgi:hypothetical protein
MESLGDNPMVQAAVAACFVLQPIFEMGDDDHPDQDWDRKQTAYLSGVTWGLHQEGRKLSPYHDTSGAMGHGFYWVCHQALEWQLKSGTWWARGSPWHPTRGLTGKVWSTDLDATIRRVNSLLSRAAHQLDCMSNWASWFRTKESFLGREIKKALPHKGTQLLVDFESQYLEQKFKAGISAYNELLKDLDEPNLGFVKSLGARIKQVGVSLQPLSGTVDRTVSHRITHVYPKERRARRDALKRPLKEVISGMSKRDYIFAFDPTILGDKRPFSVDVSSEDEEDFNWLEVRKDYERRISAFRHLGLGDLADLCSIWGDEHIAPLGYSLG